MSNPITEIVEQLRGTTKRNEKISILTENKDNDLLKATMFMVTDPYIHFFAHDLSEVEDSSTSLTHEPSEQLMIQYLYDVGVNGNRDEIREALSVVSRMVAVDESLRDLAECIIRKDLSAGTAVGTVNKVWPKLARKFDVMKGEERAHLEKMKLPLWVSQKIDGSRCVITLTPDGEVTIQSSSGRAYPNLTHLHQGIRDLAEKSGLTEMVLDGELLMQVDGKMEERAISNGKALKALNGSLSPEEEELFHMFAFDCIHPVSAFLNGKDTTPLEERQNRLHDAEYIIPVIGTKVDSFAKVWEIYDIAVNRGQEGVMVKATGSPYEAKRSKAWTKIKKEHHIDLVVTGWEEHSKKPEQVGSIEVQSSDGEIVGSVGSGFTDKDRIQLYEDAMNGELEGKICTIKVHDLTARDEQLSYYLPRFIEWRDDTEADSSEKIRDMVRWDNR